MTRRLQRGGRQLIDQLLADLADLDGSVADLDAATDLLDGLPLHLIKFNPALVDDRLRELRQLLAEHRRQSRAAAEAMRRRIRDDLAEMLARNERNAEAASLPDRVAELERRLAELTQGQAEPPGRVIPLRSGSDR